MRFDEKQLKLIEHINKHHDTDAIRVERTMRQVWDEHAGAEVWVEGILITDVEGEEIFFPLDEEDSWEWIHSGRQAGKTFWEAHDEAVKVPDDVYEKIRNVKVSGPTQFVQIGFDFARKESEYTSYFKKIMDMPEHVWKKEYLGEWYEEEDEG